MKYLLSTLFLLTACQTTPVYQEPGVEKPKVKVPLPPMPGKYTSTANRDFKLYEQQSATSKLDQSQKPIPKTITLAWDASPSENVDGYNLYQTSALGGEWTLATNVGADVLRVTLPMDSGNRFFGVKAYNEFGESDWSRE